MPSDAALRVQANRTVRRRSLGGHLILTSDLFTFRPHAFDRLTGGKQFDVAMIDIVRMQVVEFPFPSRAQRYKLFLGLRDGSAEEFIIWKKEAVVDRIVRSAYLLDVGE